jgi:putative intracellular protease/amidase
MSKALVVVTSHNRLGDTGRETGYYLTEAAPAFVALEGAGYEVDVISPQGGKAPLDQSPESTDRSAPGVAEVLDNPARQAKFDNTLRAADVDPEGYDTIYFAGGHGTMWDFPGDPDLIRLTKSIYESGGVVSAVCHGPVALVNVRLEDGRYLVEGKEVSAFTDEEETAAGLDKVVPFLLASTLTSRGARHVKAANWQPKVAVSDRVVTGQNPASAPLLAEKLIEELSARSWV